MRMPSDPDAETAEAPLHVVRLGSLEALRDFLRALRTGTGLGFVIFHHRAKEPLNRLVDWIQDVTFLPVEPAVHGAEVLRDHVYVVPPYSSLSLQNGVFDRQAAAIDAKEMPIVVVVLSGRGFNRTRIVSEIFELLHQKNGQDFSHYKRGTVFRRLDRRMMTLRLPTLEAYLQLLKIDEQERRFLYQDLLVGVTSFFRDPLVWTQLRTLIIPKILENSPNGTSIRAWVPGCSTGEEAYTLAMIFRAALDEIEPSRSRSVQIFATDLDAKAVAKARQGVYPASALQNMMEDFSQRFFTLEGKNARVHKVIRQMVIFAQHNLVHDPPFIHLDLISCRNLLIYFDNALQKKALRLLHNGLKASGYLLLGSAETVGLKTDLFLQQTGAGRFFQKKVEHRPLLQDLAHTFYLPKESAVDHPKHPQPPSGAPVGGFEYVASQLLLQEYTPAALLVTESGEILYISGRTGRYLEPTAGRANWNLFALARNGVSQALNESFHRALREKNPITIADIQVFVSNASYLTDLLVRPIMEPEALRGLVLVLFTDRGPYELKEAAAEGAEVKASVDPQRHELLARLSRTQEALVNTRREMQVSQEELKATNEELQSSNEELQATNEELTTSREEIQSINEELQTMNTELQCKVEELSYASSDMKNLLNSTEIATLFLDESLYIRRFTERATGIFKLMPTDAGRPITDLSSALDYPDMVSDAREVLRTLVFKEKQVPAFDSRWFTVRIMPYRTIDNRIDGVVITFINITASKLLEADLRRVHSALSQAFDSAAMGMAIIAGDGQWLHVNRTFCELLGYGEDEMKAKAAVELFSGEDQALFTSLLEKLMDGREGLPNQTWKGRHKRGHAVSLHIETSILRSPVGKPDSVLLRISAAANAENS